MDDLQQQSADRPGDWAVFCRIDGVIRHVGSLTAPTVGLAREQATTLFGHATDTLWLCPGDELVACGCLDGDHRVDAASGDTAGIGREDR